MLHPFLEERVSVFSAMGVVGIARRTVHACSLTPQWDSVAEPFIHFDVLDLALDIGIVAAVPSSKLVPRSSVVSY
jgi:hypothetical protein